MMARPTQEREPTERFRVNKAERLRLITDAAQAGMNKSEFIRHRVFEGQPLTTGKGLSRPELIQTLDDLAYIIKAIDGGQVVSAKQVTNIISERIYKALRNDP